MTDDKDPQRLVEQVGARVLERGRYWSRRSPAPGAGLASSALTCRAARRGFAAARSSTTTSSRRASRRASGDAGRAWRGQRSHRAGDGDRRARVAGRVTECRGNRHRRAVRGHRREARRHGLACLGGAGPRGDSVRVLTAAMTGIATRCGARPSPTRSPGCTQRNDVRRRARSAGTPALLRAVAGYGIAQRRRCARRRTCAAGPGTATTARPMAHDARLYRLGRRAEPRQRRCSCGRHRGRAFTLILDRLEHWRKPRVLCLTTSAVPAPLASLVAQLRTALATQRLPSDPTVSPAPDACAQAGALRATGRSNRCPGEQRRSRSSSRAATARAHAMSLSQAGRSPLKMILASKKLLIHRRFSACGAVAGVE